MTAKRLFLVLISILVAARLLLSLLGSLQEPQVQSRIELYQTNLVLQATEWNPPSEFSFSLEQFLEPDPYGTAQRQYQAADNETQASLEQFQNQLKMVLLSNNSAAAEQVQKAIDQATHFHYQLQLKIGLLQAIAGNLEPATFIWQRIPKTEAIAPTAAVLNQLWHGEIPAGDLGETVERLNTQLSGWFQDQALMQLFTVVDAPEQLGNLQLKDLQIHQQAMAESALVRLGIVTVLPAMGGLVGAGILLFLLGQWAFKRQNSLLGAPLAVWETPWDWETIGLVIVGGFFFFSQIFLATTLPIAAQVLGINPAAFALRGQTFYILTSYLLMTTGGLAILAYLLKPFRPLPKHWFRTKVASLWPLWGLGGYWVAIPLVLLASLLNQNLWQGQGGGNPIILLALEAKDPIALVILWSTAAIAAPIFEEIMFRGFLLPSLTRYFPTWGAIGITSLVFAMAHLSLAELFPLAILGGILGFVYGRSQNLLACIFLHSLWNSGTLVSLFVLGSV